MSAPIWRSAMPSGGHISFHERIAGIVRKVVPERLRNMFDGRRPSADGAPDFDGTRRPEREEVRLEDPQRQQERQPRTGKQRCGEPEPMRSWRHARAVDAIFSDGGSGNKASPMLLRELADARKAFDEVRPHGWRDAETAYVKNPELVGEAAYGRINRAIRALQLETEIRTDPSRRADRFVERWHKLDRTGQHQYQAGDMSGYKATRSEMGDMAKSLERDPQLESILANRKGDLGIAFESGLEIASLWNSPSITASTSGEAGAFRL